MMRPAAPTLVIGIGNEFRGDDAAGLIAARRLRTRISSRVQILEQTGEPVSLLDSWRNTNAVILLDAVRSLAPVGTIHHLDISRDPMCLDNTCLYSSHGVGIAQAIELARALRSLPPVLMIYGIEGERFELGADVSPSVEAAIHDLVAELLQRIL